MNKFIAILFVLSSIAMSGQSKTQALAEMDVIVKKTEGKVVSNMEDGSDVTVLKQSVASGYAFSLNAMDITLDSTAKAVPWESYTNITQGEEEFGYVFFTLDFDKEFEMLMSALGIDDIVAAAKLEFYVEKDNVKRFKELLKIVSGK